METPFFVLTVRCQDALGVVASVASALTDSKAFITESSHYGDADTCLFFMRTVFRPTESRFSTLDDYRDALAPVAKRFGMTMDLKEQANRLKVVIAVSRYGHCLNHLLNQWHAGELPVDIAAVVSNHEDMRRLVDWYGIPYHYLPIVNADKAAQEGRMMEIIENSGADLTILARYMQVLSDDACRRLEGRCINIHHSFLPSFKGAKPYHQAHARGVKVVGATAHYVTADLDEGPIIEQDTIRVAHNLTADDLVRIGKDVESAVLSRAVHWHAEHRILLNGARTIVFKHGT